MWTDAVCGTLPLPPVLPLDVDAAGGRERVEGRVVVVHRQADLLQVVRALHRAAPPRAPPGRPAGAGAISTAMIAMTTSSSISVNPRFVAHMGGTFPRSWGDGERSIGRSPGRRPGVAEDAGVLDDGGAGRRVVGAEDARRLLRGLAVERLGLGRLALEELDQAAIGQRGDVVGVLRAPGAADAPLVLVGQRLGLGEPARGRRRSRQRLRTERSVSGWSVGSTRRRAASACRSSGSASSSLPDLPEQGAEPVGRLERDRVVGPEGAAGCRPGSPRRSGSASPTWPDSSSRTASSVRGAERRRGLGSVMRGVELDRLAEVRLGPGVLAEREVRPADRLADRRLDVGLSLEVAADPARGAVEQRRGP